MRPQDVVILLKILLMPDSSWQYRDLSHALGISISEISDSLNRSHLAGLIDTTKKKVHRLSLMEFIEHGLHYVFPQQPGSLVTGIPTAHSYQGFRSKFSVQIEYVWPSDDGNVRGLEIQPLYKNVVKAVKQDEDLYKILAGIDIIRVGKTRELKEALKEIRKMIL